MYKILNNYSLKKLNTFRINTFAKHYVSVKNEIELVEIVNSDVFADHSVLIIGEGSNILFRSDYKGLVISIDIQGMSIVESDDDSLILEVGAGESWRNLVATCVKNKYYGLENLAEIPGTVGAAAVQNIGAYGSEHKDFCVSVRGYDLEKNKYCTIPVADCNYSYRNSVFKQALKDRFIVCSVRYKLRRSEKLNLTYQALSDEINKFPWVEPDSEYVFHCISRIRKSKLPDYDSIGNAGSFFKNPIISNEEYEVLKHNHPEIPNFPYRDNMQKVPAGKLIELAGFKGKRFADAAVYDKHALILCNYGNASGEELYGLSQNIIDKVFQMFNIKLEPEVIIL